MGCLVGRNRCLFGSGDRVSGFDFLFHAVAFPLDEDCFGMVEKAVKDSGGQGCIVVEDLGPVFKSLI
jgi:hypothetical protein